MTRRWTEATFWANTLRVGTCLEWQGKRRKHKRPYGQLNWDGREWQAHRVAWTLANGLIPVGLDVCHHCDNPPCIEPSHLFVGTQADNIHDMITKGRRHRLHGSANPAARLTPTQIEDMRELHRQGFGPRALARLFPVSHQHVSKILRGLRWGSPAI